MSKQRGDTFINPKDKKKDEHSNNKDNQPS